MFIDASALIAITGDESDRALLAGKLAIATRILISPVAIYESVLGLARLRKDTLPGAGAEITRFLEDAMVETVPIDAKVGQLALEAFARYGKGRHKANLNMGDCFAYACAKAHEVPLLFKGNDFRHTDIEAA